MNRHSENRPTPTSSHARLAAEAAFAQRPITRVANAEPQLVVIKWKKAIVPPGRGDPIGTELHEPVRVSRTPRVFRVDSPGVGSHSAMPVSERFEAGGAPRDFHAPVGIGASTARVVQVKRRRRPIPPAEVTISRPAAAREPVVSDRPASREAETVLQELKRLEPSFAAPRAAHDFDFGIPTSSAPGSYQALTAKIKKLEQHAEAARKLEAAKAARWIKRAIAIYGFRASDLGL